MAVVVKEITINNKQGLHARPAAMFVQVASKYKSTVTVQKGSEIVNGKSIMGILTLGAESGVTLTVEVEGEDAQELLNELEALLTKESI